MPATLRYKVHLEAVAQALQIVLGQGARPDKALETTLKTLRRPGARDRRFIAETTYSVIRHWRYLWFLAGTSPSLEKQAIVNLIQFYLDNNARFVKKTPDAEEKNQNLPSAVLYSLPDEAWHIGIEQLDERWLRECAAQHGPAPPHLRCNTLKISPQELIHLLESESIHTQPHPLSPEALVVLDKVHSLFSSQAFQKGLYELQDAGSQAVSHFSDPTPGMRVVDACAGAGGKSLHLAALMQNKGHIIALDVSASKLEELRRRARRAGVHIIETRVIASTKAYKRLQGTADLVLIDAPCTGTGTWRRNPDLKYRLTRSWLQNCLEVQKKVLRTYAPLVKPGGILVYATCSILPAENYLQWEQFLHHHPHFEPLDRRQLWPSEHACDGFFMAKARRNK
ncbi:MAG: methyltransferase domain-containing protein [Flavobacteriales bacterium]|nr:methyltransferase domain-containing protein [Flavobacteriales bacterium]MCX7769216.1 methyltransferase domain-containing protein [Flavobacteriales bacterium]MDW8410431.1 methyltransferase domain-containing protein [Flavobacteriales bacterium]